MMNKHLRPYGDVAMNGLVAKFGMKKTPDLKIGGKRVLGVERVARKASEI